MNQKIKNKENLESIKICEIIKLLKLFKNFLLKLEVKNDKYEKLSMFIIFLNPYKNLTINDLNDILKTNAKEKKYQLMMKKVKSITFEQLQSPEFRKTLTKEELAIVAERELGISKWNLKKLSRKEMEIDIENAFENYHTLKTIAKRASKKE